MSFAKAVGRTAQNCQKICNQFALQFTQFASDNIGKSARFADIDN